MPITMADVRAAAAEHRTATRKSDRSILEEATADDGRHFQIFLSHSFRDRELVVGTKRLIEKRGFSVYVDWIDDAALERGAVDRDRADHLRQRMQRCETLFYAHTTNASLSKWCPWELGYFDALKAPDRQVFILPIVERGGYKGQEYLGLYDVVDLATYNHAPDTRRKEAQYKRERLNDILGARRRPPFGRPML